MKTVSGKLIAPPSDISLPKAAKLLSKFISLDYGASPAFLHYLHYTSVAFNDLVSLHKKLRGSSSSPSDRRTFGENHDEVEGPPPAGDGIYQFNSIETLKKEGNEGSSVSVSIKKKKKDKNNSDGVSNTKKRKKSSEEVDVDSGEKIKKRKKVKTSKIDN